MIVSRKTEIVKSRSQDPHSVSNKNQNDRRKLKVKYRVKNISNGKFDLAPANGSPVTRKLENIHQQKSSTVQTGLVLFRNLENLENLANQSANSNLHITPGKRKLLPDDKGVRTPANSCERKVPDFTRIEVNRLESPAKKQKCGRHGD